MGAWRGRPRRFRPDVGAADEDCQVPRQGQPTAVSLFLSSQINAPLSPLKARGDQACFAMVPSPYSQASGFPDPERLAAQPRRPRNAY